MWQGSIHIILETVRRALQETAASHSLTHTGRMAAYAAVAMLHQTMPSDEAVDFTDRDWDNLLVLDACRADLFEEVADTDEFDEYERVTSPGSMTAEWANKCFPDSYGDTVYVTANPHVAIEVGDKFHALEEVYADEDHVDDLGTVRPAPVVEAAERAAEEYPNKRRVVHFMQPHHPFVESPEFHEYSNWEVESAFEGGVAEGIDDPFVALESGLVSEESVWDAYRENLEYVYDDAIELARSIPGRTVITSDHGNLLGERLSPFPIRGYGHPPRVRVPELIEVPWAVVDGERVDTDGEAVTSSVETPADTRQRRLEALGYAD